MRSTIAGCVLISLICCDPSKGESPPAEKRATPKKAVAGRFEGGNLAVIAAEPRAAIEGYFSGLAKAQVADAMRFVSQDFQGDEGDRAARVASLNGLAGFNIKTVKFVVESATKSAIHARPLNRFDRVKGEWKGELLIVSGQFSIQGTDEKGTDEVQGPVSVVIALAKEQSGWKIVSEHGESRNLVANQLADELSASLQNMAAATVWHNGKSVLLSTVIEPKLAADLKNPTFRWKPLGVLFTGDQSASPRFEGEIQVAGTTADGKATTRTYSVSLSFLLKAERLELEKVDHLQQGASSAK